MEPRVPEFGRFAEPALLILVSLSDGPKHGYAIMPDVESATGKRWGRGPSMRRSPAWRSAASSRPCHPSIGAVRIGLRGPA